MADGPFIWPPEFHHRHFSRPLTEDQKEVLEILKNTLPGPKEQWHIFVQPKLLMHQPDFVVIPRHCRNWGNCTGAEHAIDASIHRKAATIINVINLEGSTEDDPVSRTHEQRQILTNYFIYNQQANSKKAFGATKGIIITPEFTSKTATERLRNQTNLDNENAEYIEIYGEENIRGECPCVLPNQHKEYEEQIPGKTIDRLWKRLTKPDINPLHRTLLPLSKEVTETLENQIETRRVQGPAGCGKTSLIVAQAARAAAKGKQVLVLTFNITLTHYIQNLIKQEAKLLSSNNASKQQTTKPDSSTSNIDVIHFHGFLTHLGIDYGNEYNHGEVTQTIEKWIQRGQAPKKKQYDVILIDEGQDFEALWWKMLRKLCRKNPDKGFTEGGSQMLIAVDKAQDIYEKNYGKTANSQQRKDSGALGKISAGATDSRVT